MWKYREALEGQFAGMRYFYSGSVFVLWFICCLTVHRYLKYAFFGSVVAIELLLLPVVAGTPRITLDKEWKVWARYIDSGLPVTIPISPGSWFVDLPPAADGALAPLAPWIGRPLRELTNAPASATCSGSMGLIEGIESPVAVYRADGLWKAEGNAWESATKKPVQLVVLVDTTGTVTGFGFPGFHVSGLASAPPKSRWISYFSPQPGKAIHAYGILDGGRGMCRLAGERRLSSSTKMLVSGGFIDAVKIIPGREIAQRFKPEAILEGVSVQLVTFGRKPSAYAVNWRASATTSGVKTEIGAGTIDASAVKDWAFADLPLSSAGTDIPDEVEVTFTAPNGAPTPIGLPLYSSSGGDTAPPAEVGRSLPPSSGRLGLKLHYAR
jgi:hypothetical protein